MARDPYADNRKTMEEEIAESAERLWAEDPNAKERILAIDLSAYDELVTYPTGVDWPHERGKMLFLQTALRLDVPWDMVVRLTVPYFGQTLHPPFVPIIAPILPTSFLPPAFDIARQTVEQWAVAAETAWKAYRAFVTSGFQETRTHLIQSRALREFRRPRRTTGVRGQAKAPIMDEKTAYLWAVLYFFGAQFGKPLTWADLAANEPQLRKFKGSPPDRAKLKRKLAEQVRTNVTSVLRALKLPD
jgi:hypothetical protein